MKKRIEIKKKFSLHYAKLYGDLFHDIFLQIQTESDVHSHFLIIRLHITICTNRSYY